MGPAAVLAAMLALPVSFRDRIESAEARRALYLPVAEAIAVVARNEREAAFLVADGWHESGGFARAVLEYRCQDIGPRACDRGRARGTWQVHRWCAATDVVGEARCTLRAARGGVARCREHVLSPAHAFFVGAAGRPCSWPWAGERVETMERVLRLLKTTRNGDIQGFRR